MNRIAALLLMSFFAFSCAKKDFRLLVVSDSLEISEGIRKSVPGNCDVSVVESVEAMQLEDCHLLWVHDVRSPEVLDSAGIIGFVERGGTLVLTSSAALLLNDWGLEQEKISEWKYEDREVALLPFYSHPLFDDVTLEEQSSLFSAKEFSAFGFCGSAVPQMRDAAVIAVAYEDNVCNPSRKLVWETPLGRGRILTAGIDLPFDESRAVRHIEPLVANTVSYLLGKGDKDDERSLYSGVWAGDSLLVSDVHAGHHVNCKICAAEYKPVRPQRPEKIDVPEGRGGRVAGMERTIDLSQGNVRLKADETAGISEIWIDSVRVVTDYRPLMTLKDVDSVITFSAHAPEVEMHDGGFTRTYAIDGTGLTESVLLCPEQSSVVIHYQWDDTRVTQLFTEHKADLAFGYPYNGTMMSLFYVWSLELNATVVRSKDKNFCSIVGANVPGRSTLCGRYGGISYTDWRVRGVRTDEIQVASSVVYRVNGLDCMDVVISGTARGTDALLMKYARALRNPHEALNAGWGR